MLLLSACKGYTFSHLLRHPGAREGVVDCIFSLHDHTEIFSIFKNFSPLNSNRLLYINLTRGTCTLLSIPYFNFIQ